MAEQQQRKTMSHQDFMQDPYFKKWYPVWIQNAMEVYPLIKKQFKTADRCVSCLPRPMNRPAIILGSGPSLDRAAPLLKNWKNPIFSSTSTAFVTPRWGRKPEFMCAFDSLWSLYNQHLRLDKNYNWKGTTLFTHPNAEPMLMKLWKWDTYYYRRIFPGHEFFEHTFPLMFPWIKIGFVFSGCVVNNAISIATFLGYSPLILVGVDFGWQDDTKTKATNWEPDGENWIKLPEMPIDKRRKLIVYPNGTHTHDNYFGFKNHLLGIYSSGITEGTGVDIVDCSDGLIEEFAKADIEHVIKTQGWGDYGIDRAETQRKIEKYFKDFNSGKFVDVKEAPSE